MPNRSPAALANELERWINGREGYEAAVVYRSLVEESIAALRRKPTVTDAVVDNACNEFPLMLTASPFFRQFMKAALEVAFAEAANEGVESDC